MAARHVAELPEISPAEARSRIGDLSDAASLLHRTGAVLIRGAIGADPADLARLAQGFGLASAEQLEPFAVRRPLGAGVWSSPAWPRTSPMCMHNELGWMRTPPSHLMIACLRAADSGGRTGLADGRVVLESLPASLTDQASTKGWTLTRRYAEGLISTAWQDAFPDMAAADVEDYAASEGIELVWKPDSLVTRRTRDAVRTSGPDGVPSWSNLLAFCSEWTMDRAVRDYLVSTLGRDGLPFETCFGDGTPFTAQDVDAVNAAYDEATVFVDWRPGDVLLVDNIRTAHSMESYTGEREMAVLHAALAA